MKARRLAASAAGVAWAVAGAPASAFPVEIFRGLEPGWGSVACCAAFAIPMILLLALALWDERGVRSGLLVAAVACGVVIVPAWRSSVTHVVVAVSASELRVDLHPQGSPVRIGRERVPAAQVRCLIYKHESCDKDGENCRDVFSVDLMRDGRSLVPLGSETFDDVAAARGRCRPLAAYGIRMEERR